MERFADFSRPDSLAFDRVAMIKAIQICGYLYPAMSNRWIMVFPNANIHPPSAISLHASAAQITMCVLRMRQFSNPSKWYKYRKREMSDGRSCSIFEVGANGSLSHHDGMESSAWCSRTCSLNRRHGWS